MTDLFVFVYLIIHIQFSKITLAGANVNGRDLDGDTPLHICEDPEVAEFLLANGANETLVNNEELSVYQQALELENEEMVMFWAKRLGIDLTLSHQQEEEQDMMESIEEEEDGTVEMAVDSAPAPVVYPPGTVITPGEPLPAPSPAKKA
jgi:ankyrin repeat protein